MHSAVLTSTPKKIMLGEAREKKLIAQQMKDARERGKLKKPAGKDLPKRKRRVSYEASQERKEVCRRKILSESSSEEEIKSSSLCDDDECDDTKPGILNKFAF
jgi:hypothetical protein